MQGDFLFGNNKEEGGVYIWVKVEVTILAKDSLISMQMLRKESNLRWEIRRRNREKEPFNRWLLFK